MSKKYGILILFIVSFLSIRAQRDTIFGFAREDIIHDVCEMLTEDEGEESFESVYEDMMTLASQPIDINATNEDELEQLRFLSAQQIKNILLYVHNHPLYSLQELKIIPGLQEWEARNLAAFVTIGEGEKRKTLISDVFKYGQHEIIARTDVRKAEDFTHDPMYVQGRYRFHYSDKVQFGYSMRRQPNSTHVSHGGYIQINNVSVVKTIVAGNYQGQFGQGLVLSSPFTMGKSNYVLSVGMASEGLRKYSSLDGKGLHGLGTTLCFPVGKKQDFSSITMSAFYSLTKANDSTYRHIVGANLTYQYRKWKVGITAVENIYSDSLRYYYENARYNQNYFRGDNQAVAGINFRYNSGRVDIFGEATAAQNKCWGGAVQVGTRITPIDDLGLIVLYRYYSPTFDNTLGHGFSETSRINDENGIYVGLDIQLVKKWRFSMYGDAFYFSGIKYGIPYKPSWGYDAMFLSEYRPIPNYYLALRVRAREKAKQGTYSLRGRFDWNNNHWHFRTQAETNIVDGNSSRLTYGWCIFQDVEYRFRIPLTLQLRGMWFDTQNWNNRIYVYENDVLYAYSIPAIYGQGGRIYLNMRWKIIEKLSLYLRVSETIYTRSWMNKQNKNKPTITDIHLLLRANI